MDGDDGVTREDFEHALRYVADAAMQVAHDTARIEVLLRSTVRALVKTGVLALDVFERNLTSAAVRPEAAAAPRPTLQLARPQAPVPSPEIDCAALIPLCGARCCTLTVALGPEDVERGRLAWSYARPYQIAHGPDHRCVHQDRTTGGCTVYDERPAVCRGYDCRTDPRIWEDFERRIPAPEGVALPLRRR